MSYYDDDIVLDKMMRITLGGCGVVLIVTGLVSVANILLLSDMNPFGSIIGLIMALLGGSILKGSIRGGT